MPAEQQACHSDCPALVRRRGGENRRSFLCTCGCRTRWKGPTPVSALIHAATMVTAGVYHGGAFATPIFLNAPAAMQVVAVIGCVTALFAATISLVQTDIKKVLAYSTVSQLGYMFLACGVGAFSAGVFHLMTHASQGIAVPCGGQRDHAMGGEQDMRKMGGLRKKNSLDLLDDVHGHSRHRRHSRILRVLQ